MEVRDALATGNPAEFISRLPVQIDGSCNGLQHYAALGRDLAGGQSVNLLPCDMPQVCPRAQPGNATLWDDTSYQKFLGSVAKTSHGRSRSWGTPALCALCIQTLATPLLCWWKLCQGSVTLLPHRTHRENFVSLRLYGAVRSIYWGGEAHAFTCRWYLVQSTFSLQDVYPGVAMEVQK